MLNMLIDKKLHYTLSLEAFCSWSWSPGGNIKTAVLDYVRWFISQLLPVVPSLVYLNSLWVVEDRGHLKMWDMFKKDCVDYARAL